MLYINTYMYMEPRKMVLMNPFAGQNINADAENRLVGDGEGGINKG